MGRTWIRQDAQISPSKSYTDNLAAGSDLETVPTSIEGDLNSIRSQVNRMLDVSLAGNWYDDIPTVNSKKRGIKLLNTDLNDVEEHRFLFRVQMLTDITVTASQNWEVLVQASSETPTQAAAVNGGSYNGAIVASLAGDVGSHSLNEVSGPHALGPKNLLLIVDGSTGEPIQSSGRTVYGLLQGESGIADGDAFNDSDKQCQISFVRPNSTYSDLEACPVADIEGKTINYSYVRRLNYDALPEEAFLTGIFTDMAGAPVDVTLDNAIDNQSGPATQTDRNIEWRITDTYALRFQDSTGGTNLLAIIPNAAGDEIEINVDTLDVNLVNDADFSQGAKFDTGGTTINVGVTAGQIDAAGLKVASTGANDLNLVSGLELNLTDSYRAGSTWSLADGIALANSSAEWSSFETEFGEVSLLAAIVDASQKGGHNKAVAVVTSNVAADTDVGGAGGGANLDAQLLDYSGLSFTTDVNIYLNGQLLRNGADAAANHDVYPGTSAALGQLKFEFGLVASPGNPDVVTMEIFSSGL